MKWSYAAVVSLLLVFGLSFPLPGMAQESRVADTQFQEVERGPMERKGPSWWHRVSRDTPTAQLAYAHDLLSKGEIRRAGRAYNALVHRWHNSREAVQAQLSYAKVLFDLRKYTKSFDEFQYLIEQFAGRFEHDEAIRHQYWIANHVMNVRHGKLLLFKGFSDPEQALPLFEKLVRNAPNWPEAAKVRLTIGIVHEEAKDYDEAVAAYEMVEQFHPAAPEAATAAFRKGHCLYTLSGKAPRDERSCRAALSALAGFKMRYPRSDRLTEVDTFITELQDRLAGLYYDRANFYDQIAKRPESALIAYRDFLKKFPAAARADEVNRRILELERRSEQAP
jgi:outer membrane assembly lipoprotein YfiO